MGSMVRGHCSCGYGTEAMMLGGGMRDFTTECTFPYYCEECKILFIANVFQENTCCPECGSEKVVAYDDKKACKSEGEEVFSWNVKDKIGRVLKLTDGKYICPACGKFNLTFTDMGCWD